MFSIFLLSLQTLVQLSKYSKITMDTHHEANRERYQMNNRTSGEGIPPDPPSTIHVVQHNTYNVHVHVFPPSTKQNPLSNKCIFSLHVIRIQKACEFTIILLIFK